MSPGEIILFTLLTAAAATVLYLVADAQVYLRTRGRMGRPERSVFGDVVEVPEEMRLPSKKGGERPRKAGEPVTNGIQTQLQTNSNTQLAGERAGQAGIR